MHAPGTHWKTGADRRSSLSLLWDFSTFRWLCKTSLEANTLHDQTPGKNTRNERTMRWQTNVMIVWKSCAKSRQLSKQATSGRQHISTDTPRNRGESLEKRGHTSKKGHYPLLVPSVCGPQMVWECVRAYVHAYVHTCVFVCVCGGGGGVGGGGGGGGGGGRGGGGGINLKCPPLWHVHILVHSVLCLCTHAHTHMHAHTHILITFEDSELTGLKVDVAKKSSSTERWNRKMLQFRQYQLQASARWHWHQGARSGSPAQTWLAHQTGRCGAGAAPGSRKFCLLSGPLPPAKHTRMHARMHACTHIHTHTVTEIWCNSK